MNRSLYALLVCAVLRVSIATSAVSAAPALEFGAVVGPLKLTTLSGEPLVMDNCAERPATAVVFLSARCDATERAIAEINRIHGKYRLQNLLFVGVCSNPAETGEELRTFSQRRGLIFPVYRDPDGEAARRLGARVTPEVFLLDREGKLVYRGGLNDEAARRALETAAGNVLKKLPIDATSQPIEGTPIARPGPKREIDDPYGTIAFASELIFEQIPMAPAHHCSSICELAGGELLCVWYGGSYESADDQALFLARRKPDQRNWSQPQVLMRNAAQPPGNAVVFRESSERLWIVWSRMESTRPIRRGSGWNRCRLMARTSTDSGATWSEDRPVLADTMGGVPRNPPISMADGTLLLPDGQSHFLALGPGASSWQRVGSYSGGSQPAVIQRRDGSLLALLRHSQHIARIESRDGGRTWSAAVPTPLKNPGAGISMTKLANGHLVLVFNDSQTDRTPLSICRSLDEGATWEAPFQLESNPGEYSYPSIIQSADAKLHITYTFRRYAIKHVEMNEDWLVRVERND
jgi:predicted neuraminidase